MMAIDDLHLFSSHSKTKIKQSSKSLVPARKVVKECSKSRRNKIIRKGIVNTLNDLKYLFSSPLDNLITDVDINHRNKVLIESGEKHWGFVPRSRP